MTTYRQYRPSTGLQERTDLRLETLHWEGDPDLTISEEDQEVLGLSFHLAHSNHHSLLDLLPILDPADLFP